MAKYPRLRLLVLSADGINDIDASGVEMLLRIHERAKSNNIIIAIAGAKIPVITILERSNLPNDLWKESQYNSVSQAISSISLRCGLGQQPWDPEYGP
jgi:SulP family sulfate permease